MRKCLHCCVKGRFGLLGFSSLKVRTKKFARRGRKNHFYLFRLRNGGPGLFGVQLIHRGSISPLIVPSATSIEMCLSLTTVQARCDRLHSHMGELRAKRCGVTRVSLALRIASKWESLQEPVRPPQSPFTDLIACHLYSGFLSSLCWV